MASAPTPHRSSRPAHRQPVVLSCLLLATAVACATSARPGDPGRYAVLVGGRPSGTQHVARRSARELTWQFEFYDRGLGPRLAGRMVLDEDGIPLEIENSGLDYGHQPVHERFTRDAGWARWRSGPDQGESRAPGRAFYVSEFSAPEQLAVLARALLRAPGGRLPLLPAGQASIVQAGAIEVAAGSQRRRLTLYEVSGLELRPLAVWLDDTGELFASGRTIRSGWEGVGKELRAREDERASQRRGQQVAALMRKPAGPLAITNAVLFDALERRSIPHTTVLVEGQRITAVGRDGSIALPPGSERVDAAGKTLLPGLWDLHAHIAEDDGALLIAAGVTGARQPAGRTESAIVARAFDSGGAIGPRLPIAGVIDGRGPQAAPAEFLVDDEAEARAAVRHYADHHFLQVKLYNSVGPRLVPVIVEEAHRRGLRVSGHVPAHLKATDVVKLGFDELHHAYFVLLNFLDEPQLTPMGRFLAVAEKGAEIDLASPAVKDFIRLLREHDTVVELTLSAAEALLTARKGALSPVHAAIQRGLPPQALRSLRGGAIIPSAKDEARYQAAFAKTLALAGLLHRAGVRLAIGTDQDIYGLSLARELELHVQAGIAAADVLSLATIGAARIVRRDRTLGSITPGKLADLVLVQGDPTTNVSDVRNAVLVVKDGMVYQPAQIYRALGLGL